MITIPTRFIPRTRRSRGTVTVGVATLVFLLTGASSCDSSPNSQTNSQAIVEDYQKAAEAQVPYPKPEMIKGGWLERTLLKENLLRQNDKNRIAYVTLLNQLGQPIVQYTIQGMVFSLNSQMTTADRINECGSACGAVTKSPGDNGTWGPEPDGIGFFDTNGVEHKWNGLYLESDAPDGITTKPIITYDVNGATPSVKAGGVKTK